MKWFWWIGGASLFIFVKVNFGDDSVGSYLTLFAILLVSTLLGQNADARKKKSDQERRNAEANELDEELRVGARQANSEQQTTNNEQNR